MAEMFELIQASAHSLPMLADGSVHSIITSPPFYGLRSYSGNQDIEWPTVEYAPMPGLPALRVQGCEVGCEHEWGNELPHPKAEKRTPQQLQGTSSLGKNGSKSTPANSAFDADHRAQSQGAYCLHCHGWRGPLGLEPTPEAYIAHLILCLREWHRVLRDDGTCWVNLAPSYAGSWGNYGAREGNQRSRIAERWHRPAYEDDREGWTGLPPTANVSGYKPKDMIMTPFMFALAAQGDGWYVRSVAPWVKRSAMPESVTDRPTTALEYIFLLAKSQNYFYDCEAVRKRSSPTSAGNRNAFRGGGAYTNGNSFHNSSVKPNAIPGNDNNPAGRNRRNTDWLFESLGLLSDENGDPLLFDVNPAGYAGAHFATFPPALVEPMVLASTSARGVCPKCGAPWRRVVERSNSNWEKRKADGAPMRYGTNGVKGTPSYSEGVFEHREIMSMDWQPSCTCDAGDPIPATVLDPFCGSGTTGRVANTHGRRFIGVDLSAEYLEQLAPDRLELQPFLTGADMGAA